MGGKTTGSPEGGGRDQTAGGTEDSATPAAGTAAGTSPRLGPGGRSPSLDPELCSAELEACAPMAEPSTACPEAPLRLGDCTRAGGVAKIRERRPDVTGRRRSSHSAGGEEKSRGDCGETARVGVASAAEARPRRRRAGEAEGLRRTGGWDLLTGLPDLEIPGTAAASCGAGVGPATGSKTCASQSTPSAATLARSMSIRASAIFSLVPQRVYRHTHTTFLLEIQGPEEVQDSSPQYKYPLHLSPDPTNQWAKVERSDHISSILLTSPPSQGSPHLYSGVTTRLLGGTEPLFSYQHLIPNYTITYI